MFLSIVIPCYNEGENIRLLFNRFDNIIGCRDIEVIFVNNGSFDNSQAIFDQLLPAYSFARLIKIEVNQGYGYGILQGLKAAKGEYIGWSHADLQTDPLDVIKAYDLLGKSEANVFIKGKRKNRAWFDRFFTAGMSIFESFVLGTVLIDINAQPTLFTKTFYNQWENPPYDFSLDLYAFYMAKKLNLTIKRFPVFFPERIHGSSSWNTGMAAKWKFIKRTIAFSFKLKKGGLS